MAFGVIITAFHALQLYKLSLYSIIEIVNLFCLSYEEDEKKTAIPTNTTRITLHIITDKR